MIQNGNLAATCIQVAGQLLEILRRLSGLDEEEASYHSWLRCYAVEQGKQGRGRYIPAQKIKAYSSHGYRLPICEYLTLMEIYAYEMNDDEFLVQSGLTQFLNFIINSARLPNASENALSRLKKMNALFKALLSNPHMLQTDRVKRLLMEFNYDREFKNNGYEPGLPDAARH